MRAGSLQNRAFAQRGGERERAGVARGWLRFLRVRAAGGGGYVSLAKRAKPEGKRETLSARARAGA
ncbi:Hypothetical predicted protein [Podarcis lilfordi]|uniref:Uncharacterized protein n=1 Tax=Podarcis lilfordi TaxID=74358 RepID=A0AA35KWT9_9SAUR|nr:Hypothetical predicted protein [Podarcis lilfordi]